jgi:uncharacterized repeat protein (TIGR01451 family)
MKLLFKNLRTIDQSQDKSCVKLPRRLTSFLLSSTIFTGTSFSLAFSLSILGYALPAAAGGTTYCQSPYGEVYGTVTPKNLYVIHGATGASALLTTSTFTVAAINGMATDHVNKLVYYGDGNNLYAWNALTNQHILITNNFSSFLPSSYTSLYSFTTLSSGGAAFYNGSLYVGVDGRIGAGLNPSFEIFKIDFVTGSNGTTIQTVTPLNVVGNSGGGLVRTNEDWGDFTISDTGIILALTSQSNATVAHLWNYNLNTNQYTNIGFPTGGNHQFGKSGDGKIWALFSSGNVQEILPNGTYTGTTKPTVSVSDGGECVVGNATVGDRVWADVNGNGIQDAGESGITGVSVSIYRDINKDGVLAATEPLLATQTTDANGNYNFTELLPHDPLTGTGHNDFIIQITGGVPTGYTATTATRQTVDLSSATQTITTVDFGYKPPTYSVSGTLYKDNNSNNTNDSEPALAANVTVTLYNDANANNTIDAGEQVGSPVVTNASGQYNFATVPAGTYKIKVDTADTDIPAGYTLGTANDITATVASANVTGKDFGFDISAGFCNLGDGTADAAIAGYISPEVTNNLTATRSLTDTLDDAWRTATGGSSSGTVTPWFGTANTLGSVSNFTYLDTATSSSVNATVELVQVNISGLTNCGGISNTTSSTPVLSTSAALQDTSPRPTSLYNSANQPAFWNQTIVSGNDNRRFAARFTFDKPVKSFGAWFGDLETRTANGTPAILRLLDASGNRIGNDIPIQPTDLYDGTPPDPEAVDQSQCGSSGTNIGCGNSSTRWVSFVDNNSTPRVSQVLVIVGDDDFNDNGDTEILSFIGANILPAVASNPNVLLVKRITSINNSTTTRGGDNLAVYKDEASNPYDDNQITVTSPNPPTTPADTDKWVDTDNNGEPDLIGGINGGNVRPSDEIEYTIYYLSAGDATANNVLICDRVPENTTFIPTAFNNLTGKADGGLSGADRGISWMYNGATESLTNSNDGDKAEYLAPGIDPTIKYPGIKCDGSNTNGVVVVNLKNLPNATAPGTPTGSYGFIRFRGRVK